jgi:phytoene/squalene synthetase
MFMLSLLPQLTAKGKRNMGSSLCLPMAAISGIEDAVSRGARMTIAACADLVKRGDPDRFRTAMLAEGNGRAALLVLYAFNLEVARAPWIASEPMIAEMRIQWWADAIAEIFEGRPVRRHEVVSPLAEVIGKHDLPRAPFDALTTARRFDAWQEPHENRSAFESYIADTSTSLMQLSVKVLGDVPEDVSRDLGFAQGVAGVFRALPVLYASGRNPIPVTGGMDKTLIVQGEMPAPLAHTIREIATDAKKRLQAARTKKDVPISAFPALIAAWQTGATLSQAMEAPETLLSYPEQSEFRKRTSLMLRSLTKRW